MTQVVYIDVLFVINLIVNYFILLGTKRMVNAEASRWRLICGASLGALYAMIIFFPSLPGLLVFLSKLLFSVSVIFVTFGLTAPPRFLRLLACFYMISFAFAGIMLGFWYLFSPPGMSVSNGVVYVNISPVVLIVSSAAAYGLFWVLQRFFGASAREGHCRVRLAIGERTAEVDALIDTGHTLRESFSGAPVIVCEYESVKALIPTPLRRLFAGEEAPEDTAALWEKEGEFMKRYRMIPCHTVGGAGLLPAFRVDHVSVAVRGREEKLSGVYVAVSGKRLSGGAYQALVSPEAI